MYNIGEFKREVLVFQVKKQFFAFFSVIWNQWTPIHTTFCLYGDELIWKLIRIDLKIETPYLKNCRTGSMHKRDTLRATFWQNVFLVRQLNIKILLICTYLIYVKLIWKTITFYPKNCKRSYTFGSVPSPLLFSL